MHKLVYWLWLSLACTPGTATFPRLIEKFGDAKSIYDADSKSIARCIDPRSSDRVRLDDKSLDKAQEILDYCRRLRIGLLSYDDEKYPKQLKEIQSPPVILYYRGVLPDFNSAFCVSIVGTRSLSDYGRRNTFKISYDLASAGATIVSGMAMGIDGVAHAGALEADKPTVAVIGSGIDICYPNQHLALAREIVKTGCVITEFPPHTPPTKHNFPIRNRIISGLSAATVVIEGKERSGARITAGYALEQKRKLYALPGNIGSENSEVTGMLLKNGAQALTSADDIVRDFQDAYPKVINPFNLKTKLPVDIMESLSRYSVVAVCAGDDIFPEVPSRRPRRKSESEAYQKRETKVEKNDVVVDNDNEVAPCIDSLAFEVYKKIPTSGECSVESLVDSNISLRDVMKCLLKLEMGHFIKMLPGDRVSRKFKSER